MTIEEFIRARLDEDERRARAAIESGGESWRADLDPDFDGIRYAVLDQADRERVACIYEGELDSRNLAGHIARHDPARVLRQVAALRSLVAAHRTRIEQGWGYHSDEMVGADLSPLAAIWSDHPDYRPEWATI